MFISKINRWLESINKNYSINKLLYMAKLGMEVWQASNIKWQQESGGHWTKCHHQYFTFAKY